MAVVSEPPWLNQSSGTAARNGSTSHTISFGFTSTSGSLLVFVIFGAVTHTVSGWTEQLQPVNSGELSVFTKTSAGDTSITVTHNGSNYPNTWVAYEFPAGSSYTAGVGDTTSSDTFPSLTGLPGTEQVVIAALGRTAASLSETAASATWSAPWVEDADLFVGFASTDGAALFVAHQINVTATSITPATTPTYTGSWGTPDREKVVFALDVAASGGGLTRTVDDAAGLIDAATAASAFERTQSDSAGLTDTASRVVDFGRSQTDVAGLNDATATAASFIRTQSDGAGLTDSAIRSLAVAVAVADSAGLIDSATPVLTPTGAAFTRTVDDPAGLADASAKTSGHSRVQDDGAGLIDLAALVFSAARTSVDTVGLTDSVVPQMNGSTTHTRTITDLAGLTSSHRFLRLTHRPSAGVTYRPDAGITSRHALVPD